MNIVFFMGAFLVKKQLLQKHLRLERIMMKKNRILIWRKTLQRKVKRYIDNHLNPCKVNIIDPRKEFFLQPNFS